MGFLDWLFGKNDINKPIVDLSGPGTFSFEIVGESHYQTALKSICDGSTDESQKKIVEAILIHEDGNPYDDKAIRVDIYGKTVGYFSRKHARQYRNKMIEAGYRGTNASCSAMILGGWDRGIDNRGHFGVKLDLPTADERAGGDSGHHSNTLNFILTVTQANAKELAQTTIGDYVNFWSPPDNPTKVLIYRKGSIGGIGKIGYVSHEYANIISTHMKKGLEFETELVETNIKKSYCKIECKLFGPTETAARRKTRSKAAAEELKSKLKKASIPKKYFSVRIQLPKNHNLNEGQQIYLKKQPLKYYLHNAEHLHIDFVDENGIVVGRKENEPRLIRSILSAFFRRYELAFQITEIEKPDKSSLKYMDGIEAKAKVFFEKTNSVTT